MRRPNGRYRAPNLRLADRLLCGFGALFLSPARIGKVAIALRPSTLLAFHQALVRRKYAGCFRRRFARRSRARKGRTRRSSKPSSNSSRAILGSAAHGSRASSRKRSGSTLIRTSSIACCRSTIGLLRAEADPHGCRMAHAMARRPEWVADSGRFFTMAAHPADRRRSIDPAVTARTRSSPRRSDRLPPCSAAPSDTNKSAA